MRLNRGGTGYTGFNGATAMKPWKSPPLDTINQPPLTLQWGHGDEAVEEKTPDTMAGMLNMLQWGHGDEAVEEGANAAPTFRTLVASMGPRR